MEKICVVTDTVSQVELTIHYKKTLLLCTSAAQLHVHTAQLHVHTVLSQAEIFHFTIKLHFHFQLPKFQIEHKPTLLEHRLVKKYFFQKFWLTAFPLLLLNLLFYFTLLVTLNTFALLIPRPGSNNNTCETWSILMVMGLYWQYSRMCSFLFFFFWLLFWFF